MNILIFLVACVILLCVFVEKFSDKFGMPALIFFMFIGMLFGSCDHSRDYNIAVQCDFKDFFGRKLSNRCSAFFH